MSTKISKQTVTRILALNNMSNLRSSPMTPMMSRTQVRSRPEGGVAAIFQPGDQIVINLQNKTDYVDPLQSFLKFKIRTVNTDYMHDKKSLEEICFKSKFKNYTIKFMNIHKKRRLVMILKK